MVKYTNIPVGSQVKNERRFFSAAGGLPASFWRGLPTNVRPSIIRIDIIGGLPASFWRGLPTNVRPSIIRIDIIGGLARERNLSYFEFRKSVY
jgi:hypothetical protein